MLFKLNISSNQHLLESLLIWAYPNSHPTFPFLHNLVNEKASFFLSFQNDSSRMSGGQEGIMDIKPQQMYSFGHTHQGKQ